MEEKSTFDEVIERVTSLLGQSRARSPEHQNRVFYTIGAIQGFLYILSISSPLSASQKDLIKKMALAWEEALKPDSIGTSESEN